MCANSGKAALTLMASPFMAPPAGTDVPPSSDTRYFYRRQVYSRNPVTGTEPEPEPEPEPGTFDI